MENSRKTGLALAAVLVSILVAVSVVIYLVVIRATAQSDAKPAGSVETTIESAESGDDGEFVSMKPEDCTSVEKYDNETQQCYIECETSEECDRLAAQVEAELDEYFEQSESKVDAGSGAAGGSGSAPSDTDSAASAEVGEVAGALYQVQSDLRLSPQPTAEHQKLWDLFSAVASKSVAAEQIESFEIVNDPDSGMAAAVGPASAPGKWGVTINEVFADDKKDMIHTMIHEYGHVLTLGKDQVDGGVNSACPRLQITEGCTTPGSYLNAFYTKFWAKYGAQIPGEDSSYDEFDKFYRSQPEDTFVSEYAASNSVEDLAESWAVFVLREKPTGTTEADAKVAFFYDYPELVKERDRIRKAVSSFIG